MNPGPDSPERDPALESAWRAHSREAPPPELDRAILAAAHRAVGSGPQDASKAAAEAAMEATRPQRWWMPLAAAATIGVVAIGMLQLTTPEESLVAPNERVAAVAPRGAEDKRPAPAVGQNADDARKERDAAVPAARNDVAGVEPKKKQEAQPRTPHSRAVTLEARGADRARDGGRHGQAGGTRTGAPALPRRDRATKKRDGRSEARRAKRVAPRRPPMRSRKRPPPRRSRRPWRWPKSARLARKDTAGERQQLAAATDQSTASAPPGRSGPSSDRCSIIVCRRAGVTCVVATRA